MAIYQLRHRRPATRLLAEKLGETVASSKAWTKLLGER
jgi:hypothetical protein